MTHASPAIAPAHIANALAFRARLAVAAVEAGRPFTPRETLASDNGDHHVRNARAFRARLGDAAGSRA